MSAPQIRTLRNTIDSVIVLLDELYPDVADVHDLAYNRHVALKAKVRGGSHDYALDTHGDPRARELYIAIAARLVGLGRQAEKDLKALRRYLNQDDGRPLRRDGSADVTASEFDQARHARARRLQRGEPHPHPLVSQPERKHLVDPVNELDFLRAAVRRMAGRFETEHQGCIDEHGKRKSRRFDRSLLSQGQRDAWDRAFLVGGEDVAAS